MADPVISCIIPTYNRAQLLKCAIESTINQTFPYWELIIVDDGSIDSTEQTVSSYCKKYNRIYYFKNPGKGGAAARNYGISKSKGEYIAFLDDDDVNLQHSFESQLNAANKAGSAFIVSGYEVRDRDSNKIKSQIKLELKGRGAGFPSRWFIKRELLEKVAGFDESFPSMQDIELSYRLAQQEIFALHDDVVSIIYPTPNSISTNNKNAINGKVMLMDKRGDLMHAAEAAHWYFIIATAYFNLGDKSRSNVYVRKAIDTDNRYKYLLGYFCMVCEPYSIKIIDRIVLKLLKKIHDYKFPNLVLHPVIK